MTPVNFAKRIVTRFMAHVRVAVWLWSARARQAFSRRKWRRSSVPAMSPSDRQIAADLADHGIHVTTLDQLAMPDTDRLRAQANDCVRQLADADPGVAEGENDSIFFVLADPRKLVAERTTLLLWGLQDRILNIVEAYLGQPAHCLGIFARRDLADGTERGTRRWHIDINDVRYLKIIVYLNDVSAEGGPFQYLPDTVSRALLRAGRSKSLDDVRIATLGKTDMESCEGPAGTVIFVDTARLYHRGRRPEHERFTLFFSYASRHPSRPDLCAAVHFRSGFAHLTAPLTQRQRDSLDWPR
jgi:hypothetical protein